MRTLADTRCRLDVPSFPSLHNTCYRTLHEWHQLYCQMIGAELFPPNFPPELASAAFVGGKETAWPPTLAAAGVEWLGTHGYAVLGTELWVLKSGAIQSLPIGQSGMREVHGNSVSRGREESWISFVARAAMGTLAYLQSFNSADILEQGEIHFNVVWVSEAQYAELKSV
jgi:hypothetical protein